VFEDGGSYGSQGGGRGGCCRIVEQWFVLGTHLCLSGTILWKHAGCVCFLLVQGTGEGRRGGVLVCTAGSSKCGVPDVDSQQN
jgi:hypothetical protein